MRRQFIFKQLERNLCMLFVELNVLATVVSTDSTRFFIFLFHRCKNKAVSNGAKFVFISLPIVCLKIYDQTQEIYVLDYLCEWHSNIPNIANVYVLIVKTIYKIEPQESANYIYVAFFFILGMRIKNRG